MNKLRATATPTYEILYDRQDNSVSIILLFHRHPFFILISIIRSSYHLELLSSLWLVSGHSCRPLVNLRVTAPDTSSWCSTYITIRRFATPKRKNLEFRVPALRSYFPCKFEAAFATVHSNCHSLPRFDPNEHIHPWMSVCPCIKQNTRYITSHTDGHALSLSTVQAREEFIYFYVEYHRRHTESIIITVYVHNKCKPPFPVYGARSH